MQNSGERCREKEKLYQFVSVSDDSPAEDGDFLRSTYNRATTNDCIHSNVAMRLSGIQMAEPHSLQFFAGPPGIETAMTYFRRTKNQLIGWDSRSRTKDKVRDGEEIAWVNFLAR
jgi:hypothetical protein